MDGYGEDLAAIHAAGFTDMAQDAARELLGRLPARARVLELGCGDGTTAALLSAAGHDVVGIDLSPALIALARRRAPEASFRVGSFLDAPLPDRCDAVLAVGEVFAYALDARVETRSLDSVFARCAGALRRGGVLLFDLPGPGRVVAPRRRWSEGDGWAVLVDTGVEGQVMTRRIVTFRDAGDGRFHRAEETHRLLLHRPADVLPRLRHAGFSARTLPGGYAGAGLAPGLTAYLAHLRRPGG